MSDEQLSQIFKRDLPRQDDGAWAEDARRRHGRRRAAIGGVSVVAALALVVPFALQLVDREADVAVPAPIGTEPSEAPTAETQDPGAAGSRAAACSGAAENAGDELPETAERLWLCDEGGEIGFGRKGPQEPLTQGVDAALAAFHGLDVAPADQACTMEYGLTYVVVAEAADGTLTPISGGLHGCRTVGNRSGADGYLATLGELWAEQRASEPVPAERIAAQELCATQGSILPATVDGATQAAICEPQGFDGEAVNAVEVPGDVLQQVQAAIADGTVSGTLGEWEPTARLVLADPWGEMVALTRHASGTYQWDGRLWRPDGALAATLDAMVEQLGIAPSEPVDQPVQECTEARAAVATTGATIEGDITYVSICVENREGEPRWKAPGMGGIVEPSQVRAAVAAFNDLPELTGECEDTSRADVFVEYRGDAGMVAAAKVTSCGPATGAVAKDGASFVEDLVNLTRDPAMAGTTYYAAQDLCPQADALIRFDPVQERANQVVACIGADGELPVDLTADVVDAMAGAITSEPVAADAWEPADGTLIWINQYGDPLTMVRGADGSFAWPDGDGGLYQWMPTGELKEQLDRIFNL